MRNNLLLFLVIIAQSAASQMIESISRPYRFDIDKTLEYEDISIATGFELMPARTLIRNGIEKELSIWFENEGHKYKEDPTYEERVIRQIEEIQPRIIHLVGIDLFNHCIPEYYFVQGSLQFEIQLNGFKPFRIGIPLSDVESFRLHSDKLSYSDQKIAFSDSDQFVISYLKIFNPDNGKKYIFYNTEDESIKAPSFAISVSQIDL